MKVKCPKCESKYDVKLEQVPEKGQKLECASCEHVFLVRPKPENIDASLASLKDKFSDWDSKIASAEEDSFTQDLFSEDEDPKFTDTSSDELNRLLEEAEVETASSEKQGDEGDEGQAGESAEISDDLIDNLFEEVESRDLLEDSDSESPGVEEEKIAADEVMKETGDSLDIFNEEESETGEEKEKSSETVEEEADNIFDDLMEDTPGATEATADTSDDLDFEFDDMFEEDAKGAATAPESEAQTDDSKETSGEGIVDITTSAPQQPLDADSTAIRELDSAFDDVFGEEAEKPSSQEEEPPKSDLSASVEEPVAAEAEDEETKIMETPPGPLAAEGDGAVEKEEDLWASALEEQKTSEAEQKEGASSPEAETESEEDLWASALEEQKTSEAGKEDNDTTKIAEPLPVAEGETAETMEESEGVKEEPAAESAGEEPGEADSGKTQEIDQGSLDALFAEAEKEEAKEQVDASDTGEESSSDKTEIIKQDELDGLWDQAQAEQTESKEDAGGEKKEDTGDLWDAALEEQASADETKGEGEEKAEGELVSQGELDNLFSQASEEESKEGETTQMEELTSQTEVMEIEEEKTTAAAQEESGEAEEDAGEKEGGEEEDFDFDEELLEGKKSLKDKIIGILPLKYLSFKFLPEGKTRTIILAVLGVLLLGIIGAGGYFIYGRYSAEPVKTEKGKTEKTSIKAKAEKTEKTETAKEEGEKEESEAGKGSPAPAQTAESVPRTPVSEKEVMDIGLIIPIQFGPVEMKILQADFQFVMSNHKSYQELKFHLPIYQELMEKTANEFFNKGFYNEIHYAKEKLKDKVQEAFNKEIKDGRVEKVKIKKFVIDIEKEKEKKKKEEQAAKKKKEESKEGGEKEK